MTEQLFPRREALNIAKAPLLANMRLLVRALFELVPEEKATDGKKLCCQPAYEEMLDPIILALSKEEK